MINNSLMYLIVGLGNVGKQYENTYHNAGFMVADFLAEKLEIKFKKNDCNAYVAEGFFEGEKIILAKPKTFMNLSGVSVRQFAEKYKLASEKIIVAVDDIDLPLGEIRYREKGSGGTHNGLKNIVLELGSENFKRVKVGVGKDENVPLADYVLSHINKEKLEILSESASKAAEKILEIL